MDLEKLKYPIGTFDCPENITSDHLKDWIQQLEVFPEELWKEVSSLSEKQLDMPYRPEGWTVRQLVHHIADSHHHSYTRFKWALTEDRPVIKAYEEKDWANQKDGLSAPISISLNYIAALHVKMVHMLKELSDEQLQRVYIHPDGNQPVTLAENIGKYAWHGQHHLHHIIEFKKRDN